LAQSGFSDLNPTFAAAVDGGGFVVIYALVLWMVERDRLVGYARMVKHMLGVAR
jgi:hypothetical protein